MNFSWVCNVSHHTLSTKIYSSTIEKVYGHRPIKTFLVIAQLLYKQFVHKNYLKVWINKKQIDVFKNVTKILML